MPAANIIDSFLLAVSGQRVYAVSLASQPAAPPSLQSIMAARNSFPLARVSFAKRPVVLGGQSLSAQGETTFFTPPQTVAPILVWGFALVEDDPASAWFTMSPMPNGSVSIRADQAGLFLRVNVNLGNVRES